VPTDTVRGQMDAVKFALRAVAWSLGLFGLLRLNWIEVHVVLPFTGVQATGAAGLFGASALPVEVTLACSGADALALCLGAVLAYPVKWRTRVAGAGGGTALILGLNTLRIGTLGRAAVWPTWFNILHVYVWPAVLTLAIAGYVFTWMCLADRRRTLDGQGIAVREPFLANRPHPSRRFVVLTVVFLLLFVGASPLYLESPSVLALAAFIARAAAVTLGFAGISAHAAANVLWTPRGGFVVTQECISTPLIPIYLAAICTYSATRRSLVLGVLATLPLFIALGIVRLWVVALPDVVASPLFFVHAFYQLLLGAVIVFIAARWRHGGRAAPGYALVGVIVGVLFVYLLGPSYTRLVQHVQQGGAPIDDPQGAIGLLPAFQIGLYLALWIAAFGAVGWWRFLAGLAVLGVTQTASWLALHALASHAGLTADVRDVRGWAVAGPVLVFAAAVNLARPRH
jgi:exosortase/archaeosortase family protein